jgi:hypothetical protein
MCTAFPNPWMAAVSDDLENAPPEDALRRNFLLGVLNGAAYRLPLTLADASIVVPWFVSRVTSSPALCGPREKSSICVHSRTVLYSRS